MLTRNLQQRKSLVAMSMLSDDSGSSSDDGGSSSSSSDSTTGDGCWICYVVENHVFHLLLFNNFVPCSVVFWLRFVNVSEKVAVSALILRNRI